MLHVSVHTKIVCVVRPLVIRTLQSDTSGRPDATLSPNLGADSVDQAGDVGMSQPASVDRSILISSFSIKIQILFTIFHILKGNIFYEKY